VKAAGAGHAGNIRSGAISRGWYRRCDGAEHGGEDGEEDDLHGLGGLVKAGDEPASLGKRWREISEETRRR
jgi:hypothetical protein